MNNKTNTDDIKPSLQSLIKFEDENHENISTAYNDEELNPLAETHPLAVQITVIKEEYIEQNNDDIANENYEFNNANDLITFEADKDVGTEIFVKEEYSIDVKANGAESFKYVCKFCRKIFEDWKTLLKHNLTHLTLKLEKCNQPLPKKTSITKKSPDSNTGLWHCIVCYKNYDQYKKWFQHVTEVHTAYNFVCKFCQKLYHTNRGIIKHLRVVHNNVKARYLTKNQSPCSQCNAVLDNKHALKTHMRTVHSSKSFECDVCGLKYKCFSYLQTHKRRVHNESGQFICDVCFATFKSRRRLLIHIRRPHVRLDRQKSGENVVGKKK